MSEVTGWLLASLIPASFVGYSLYRVGALHACVLGGSSSPNGDEQRHEDRP